jgi:hypothetical protein
VVLRKWPGQEKQFGPAFGREEPTLADDKAVGEDGAPGLDQHPVKLVCYQGEGDGVGEHTAGCGNGHG